MRSLFIIAVSGVLLCSSVQTTHAQKWKEKIGLTNNKNNEVKAEDLSDEEVEELLRGKKEDDGITNDFHQQNVRKIVFHDSNLDPQDVNANTVQKKFSINDPIYFTFYLPYSVRNHILFEVDEAGNKKMDFSYDYRYKKWKGTAEQPTFNEYGSMKIKFFLDGKETDAGEYISDAGYNSTKTIISHWITADPKEKDVRKQWIELVQNLSPGDHEVKVVIYGHKTPRGTTVLRTLEPIASGSFTLVKKQGEKYAPKYGVSWADYRAGKKDADLEVKMLKSMRDAADREGYKEEYLDLKIKSADWIITRNELTGVVTGRNLVAYCKTKWPDGTCKVQSFVFRQEHNGTDFQSSIYCMGPLGGSYQKAIDCD